MIEVQSVSKQLGGRPVLSEVSFNAVDGEVTGFVGPNGAGKTTVMKIIAGLLPPDKGLTLVDGSPFTQAPSPSSRLGILINSEWIPGKLKGVNYLKYVCATQAIPYGRIRPLLEAVELWGAHERPVAEYSLGMRQRLGIAAALLGDPANLMLDEPVNGLDPAGVVWLRNLLRRLASEGRAVLLSSHLMAELELVADRFVLLHSGEVTRTGTVAELAASSADLGVYICGSDLPETLQLLQSHGLQTHHHKVGAIVTGATAEQVGSLVFGSGLTLSHLLPHSPSLEDVFLSVTGTTQAEEVQP